MARKKIWTPHLGEFPTWAMQNKPSEDFDFFQGSWGSFTDNVTDHLTGQTHSFATSNINPLTENKNKNKIHITRDSGGYARMGAKVNNAHWMSHAWGDPKTSHKDWMDKKKRTRLPRVYGFEAQYRWAVDGNNRSGAYTYISAVWFRYFKPPSGYLNNTDWAEYDFKLNQTGAQTSDPGLYPTAKDDYGKKRSDDWKGVKFTIPIDAQTFVKNNNVYLKSVMIQQEFTPMSGIALETRTMDWRKMNFLFLKGQTPKPTPIIYQPTQRAWFPDPLYDGPLKPFLI